MPCGETSESVVGELGITTTHIYVIKCRIERLLAKEGERHYAAIGRRLFRQAA